MITGYNSAAAGAASASWKMNEMDEVALDGNSFVWAKFYDQSVRCASKRGGDYRKPRCECTPCIGQSLMRLLRTNSEATNN